jgi:predicted ester cyclase
MPADPAHEDLLNRILKAFDSGDAEGAAAQYEPDAAYYLYPDVMHGREAVRASVQSWLTAFPDTKWHVKNLMSSGDTFIAEGLFRGTHTGPLGTPEGEIPPTGKSVELPCCFIGQVSENGLIAEDRTYLNAAIMMEQLGLT